MDPLQKQPEALLEVWGVCFRDHLQLEPTLNHCKRRGRTGCMCSRSRRRGLSVLKVLGLHGWAVFPPAETFARTFLLFTDRS